MNFGDRLKERREELGLTLQQLADKIGVSNATVQRYESGRIKTPRMPQLQALAKVLNVDTNYLLGLQEGNAAPDLESPLQKVKLTAREQILLSRYKNMPDTERRAVYCLLDYIGTLQHQIHKLELRIEVTDEFLEGEGLRSEAEDYLDKNDDWQFINE